MKFFTKRLNNKGFTLVELIVVIAILGILVAIAVPRLSGFRDDATTAATEANDRMIDSAVAVYESRWGEGTADADNIVGYFEDGEIPTPNNHDIDD